MLFETADTLFRHSYWAKKTKQNKYTQTNEAHRSIFLVYFFCKPDSLKLIIPNEQ